MRRSYTRSSEKEILVQLRNSLNPYEKIETRIMIVQAFTAVVAVVCLLGIAIVGYTKIKDIRVSVQTVAVETTEMANLTSTMGDEMDLMVKTMEPVLLLPNITLEMEQMETGVNQLVSVPFLLLIHPLPPIRSLASVGSDLTLPSFCRLPERHHMRVASLCSHLPSQAPGVLRPGRERGISDHHRRVQGVQAERIVLRVRAEIAESEGGVEGEDRRSPGGRRWTVAPVRPDNSFPKNI